MASSGPTLPFLPGYNPDPRLTVEFENIVILCMVLRCCLSLSISSIPNHLSFFIIAASFCVTNLSLSRLLSS